LNVLNDTGGLAAQTSTSSDLNFDEPCLGHLIGDDHGQSIAPHSIEPTINWFAEAESSNPEDGKTWEKTCYRQIVEDF
jgi:hypothetical protein